VARGAATAEAFVPLSFAPGEAYQFDWSHEIIVLGGVTTKIKLAHVRLYHSRMAFVRAYPRESQEMVFDAHARAFEFFKGSCTRGIYDNMKTAVEAVFIGKDRQFNRRFLQMCGHYLIEPAACTLAAGWEKGQVENQVGNIRERLFAPRPRVASYDELNAWLLDQCIAYARANRHPEQSEQTIWQVFEAERAALVPIASPFDGFRATQAAVSKTCLVRFDNNKYSVNARAVGRPVEIQAFAERLVIRRDGAIVGEHVRRFGRNQTIYDPWHYVPVLARKPGALRNGAPFKDWLLPTHLERVRRQLKGSDDGDRQMVKILAAVLSDGLAAVEAPAPRRSPTGPFRRRHPKRSGAAPRSRAGRDDPGARGAASATGTHRRLRALRQLAARRLMERSDVLELMTRLKLFGMRAAYDEVMATALKRRAPRRASSANCSPPRSPRKRRARSSIS